MKKFLSFSFALGMAAFSFAQAGPCDSQNCPTNNTYVGTEPALDFGSTSAGCFTTTAKRVGFFRLTVAAGNLFTFEVRPNTPKDYDWLLWKNPNCNNLKTTVPDRASYSIAGTTGWTGLNSTSVDLCEGVLGDNYCAPLAVVPGDKLILMIDMYSAGFEGFTLVYNQDPLSASTNVLCTLSTIEVDKEGAKVYPNPVTDALNVESLTTVDSYEIYSTTGALIKTVKNLNQTKFEINTSELPIGTFMIRLKGNEDKTIKFVKKY